MTQHDKDFGTTTTQNTDSDVRERLQFVWDQHINSLKFSLTIATGTILWLATIFIEDNRLAKIKSLDEWIRWLGLVGVILLLLSIILAIIHRALTQVLMVYEVMGPRHEVKKYLEDIGVPVEKVNKLSDSYTTYVYLKPFNPKILLYWKWTSKGFGASLIFGFIFTFSFLIIFFWFTTAS